ncbi:hypothetical protein [Rhodosalinus sediminis]|uniref:hypothetical protein n=1 Tax=Rhodosalinus sediminis TaxID=1940533 RepID=UPI0023537707|nr:hypothetical protein [Rhodosalinus sediminis]
MSTTALCLCEGIQSAFIDGIRVFIDDGASVSDVFWKIIGSPSTSNSSNGSVTMRLGGINVTAPRDVAWPSSCVTKP